LPRREIEALLEAVERSNAQRAAITAVFAELGSTFGETRAALNESARGSAAWRSVVH
jgi:hypothetical protein